MGRASGSSSRVRRRLIVLGLVVAAVVYGAIVTRLERAAIAAQQPVVAAANTARVDRDELMRLVRTLSAAEFEGRRTGSPGGVAARRLIREEFAAIGLRPAGNDFLHPFTFEHSSVKGLVLPGRPWKTRYNDAANIIGLVPGTQPNARTIVVTAHYDHTGIRDGVLYPGADDNASGVAALLAIARYVRANPLPHQVVFAALDGEELGLQGAIAFMKAPPVPASSIALNINLDMVSRNDHNEIFAAGTYHTPSLKAIVDEVQTRSPVKILFGHDRPMTRAGMVEDWTLQSDHGVFHKSGIPFLYFGVEDHADYHQPTDTADKIDPTFFGNVADILVDVVVTADRRLL